MPDTADTLLEPLDDEQRRAAEQLSGPLRILAGAGTGKTRTIAHRIAFGVATGAYAPNRVLALTFTTRAAAELRERLRVLGASGVSARTFHSAALAQLNFFWPHTVGGSLPTVLDGKGRLLAAAAQSLRMSADTAILRDVAAEIEWRKVSSLSVDGYARTVEKGARALPDALPVERVVSMMNRYEQLKDERRAVDFEDVLLVCAGMIEAEPAVAAQVREQYRFFVVDEYQDVSPLQQHLLELWLGDRRELCVVGDASQTIYTFAGARSSYLLEFERRWPDAELVRLERNYRSSPQIVAAANALMRDRPGALHLRSGAPAGPRLRIDAFTSDVDEAETLAEAVQRSIRSGTDPGTIAVLHRVNSQSALVQSAFQQRDIPFQLRGSGRFFELPEVRQAILALRGAAITVGDEPLFKSVSDVLRSLGWTHTAPEARGAIRDRWESLDALMSLVDEQPPGATLRAFTDELQRRQQAQHEPPRSAVTIATLHAAKGLEWDEVHIVGVSEGLLPISYARTPGQIDEERRLLYVGTTRARRSLSVSWSAHGSGRSSARMPSRFLLELSTGTSDVASG